MNEVFGQMKNCDSKSDYSPRLKPWAIIGLNSPFLKGGLKGVLYSHHIKSELGLIRL